MSKSIDKTYRSEEKRKKDKHAVSKTVTMFTLCVVALAGGLSSLLLAEYYGALRTSSNPTPSLHVENLKIESHSSELLTNWATAIELTNTGNTTVQISEVKVNGHSTQSTRIWNQAWNGVTLLQPGQTGIMNVYVGCYANALTLTKPHYWREPLQQVGLENRESWKISYDCTFTFVTTTQREYSFTIQRAAWIDEVLAQINYRSTDFIPMP